MKMRKIFAFVALASIHGQATAQYDGDYAGIGTEIIDNEKYTVVEMTRKDQRIKVKYFADKDYSGKSVYSRYLEWSRNRSVVCASVGTYFDDSRRPVGICIDDGYIINRTEMNMDGLVIVYKTGGIVATNIKEGNLTVQSPEGGSMVLNIRNSLDRSRFFKWAQENNATVFQSHLLYYKNEMKISSVNSKSDMRERRMLGVAKDDEGNIRYYVINLKSYNTLYNATEKIVRYLKKKSGITDVVFLINLDTGFQDAFQVRRPDGSIITNKDFTGEKELSVAQNLLVFYFE